MIEGIVPKDELRVSSLLSNAPPGSVKALETQPEAGALPAYRPLCWAAIWPILWARKWATV